MTPTVRSCKARRIVSHARRGGRTHWSLELSKSTNKLHTLAVPQLGRCTRARNALGSPASRRRRVRAAPLTRPLLAARLVRRLPRVANGAPASLACADGAAPVVVGCACCWSAITSQSGEIRCRLRCAPQSAASPQSVVARQLYAPLVAQHLGGQRWSAGGVQQRRRSIDTATSPPPCP